jgi:hypothetical protein
MMSLFTCVIAGVIGADGIAMTGSVGRAAKAEAASATSMKRFMTELRRCQGYQKK